MMFNDVQQHIELTLEKCFSVFNKLSWKQFAYFTKYRSKLSHFANLYSILLLTYSQIWSDGRMVSASASKSVVHRFAYRRRYLIGG